MFFSIILSGYVGIGNIIEGRNNNLPDQRLELSVTECLVRNIGSNVEGRPLSDFDYQGNWSYTHASDWKELHTDDSFARKIWSISYIWQPGIGCVSTILFSIIFSYIIIAINRKSIEKVHRNLLSKPWLRFWERILGQEKMSNWVDYSDEETFRIKKIDLNNLTITGGPEDDLNANKDEMSLQNYVHGTIPKVNLDV